MARICDEYTANKIARLWARVEDAVLDLDDCMGSKAVTELEAEWRRFRGEFERFFEVLTDAIES